MKRLLLQAGWQKLAFYLFFIVSASSLVTSCKKKEPPEPVLKISTVASGLAGPIGIEVDQKGRIWIAESGTGVNDGKVVVITQDGQKHDAFINFESIMSDGGESEGPAHLMIADGIIYILGAHGKLYKASESAYILGGPAVSASKLAVEDLGKFVLAYKFKNDTEMTHPYNLIKGPDDAIYIADAAANAIIRRDKTGLLSVVVEVPGVPNPLPMGPPQVESVPTGIIYDGQNFLVTTLLGFPFPPGKSVIYKISPAGAVSIFQEGFTSLVDIAAGGPRGRLVLEHGVFGAMGFGAKTGKLLWATGSSRSLLADGFNEPAGLKQVDEHNWYVTSFKDGTLLKVSY